MQPWFTGTLISDVLLWSTDTCQNKVSADRIMWPYRGLKFTTHRRHVFFQSWLLTKWSGFFSIGSRAHVRLTYLKPGRIVWKPAKASPGLKFIQFTPFSSLRMFFFFFLLLLCFMFIKFKTENLIAKLQNLNRNFTFSWVSLIGFSTTWPEGATLLGWPKSIYYRIG